jgi:hypothetical protein
MPASSPTVAGDAFDRIPKVELHCHVEGTESTWLDPSDRRALVRDFEEALSAGVRT